ncbi:MAG: SDR family oxidoreductase [Methylococcaceae bacterium]
MKAHNILVTGASSGIGRAVAVNLLKASHSVIGIARDVAKFKHHHPHFYPVAMDLSQLHKLTEKFKLLCVDYPNIDAVVFCAGQGLFGSLEQYSAEQIQSLINLNFTSQALMARLLVPKMKQQGRGHIIFLGSEAALKGSRQGTIYCASKFAVRGFAQALREECANSGVRVTLINPGMVRSPFFDTLTFQPGQKATQYLLPEDVAEAVSYVIHSRADMVVDEINLNPLNRVVKAKNKDKSS